MKERGVFHTREDRFRIVEGGFEVPYAFELPRARRSVVPAVFTDLTLVHEAVALAGRGLSGCRHLLAAGRRPGLPAVVRPLQNLTEPTAGLRCVDPVGIDGRSFHVIDLPAAEMRAVDRPVLTLAVRAENESTFLGAHENPYTAHRILLR